MRVPSHATLTSFVAGTALALGILWGGAAVRHRIACAGVACDDGDAAGVAPEQGRVSDHEPPDAHPPRPAGRAVGGPLRDIGDSVYVMAADDPAERALAEALRAHDDTVRRTAAEDRPGTTTTSEPAPPRVAVDATAPDVEANAPPERAAPPPPRRERERLASRGRGDEERTTPAPRLDGWWLFTNTIETTDYSPYEGLRIGYRVHLHRDGDHVTGSGTKWAENGQRIPRRQRTPIFVSGTVLDDRVEMRFVEHGSERVSEGRFQWQLSADATHLSGRFESTAASTSGSSDGHRVR